jgi:hypothetical protein
VRLPVGAGHCQTAGMDDTTRTSADPSLNGVAFGRRTFFGRALLAVGATAGLLTLTGCPGGEQDDDGGDDDGGDDD